MDLIIPEGINRGVTTMVAMAPGVAPEVDPRRVIQDRIQSLTLFTNSIPAVLQGDDYMRDHP